MKYRRIKKDIVINLFLFTLRKNIFKINGIFFKLEFRFISVFALYVQHNLLYISDKTRVRKKKPGRIIQNIHTQVCQN